jgi:hypothetical protein
MQRREQELPPSWEARSSFGSKVTRSLCGRDGMRATEVSRCGHGSVLRQS